MTLATGVAAGVYAKYDGLLREELKNSYPGLDVRLVPSQGSVDNLRQVAEGRADFAIAAADAAAEYRSAGGNGSRLRACARLYDDFLHLVVAHDSPVRSVRDLRGARVGVGGVESGVQLVARRVLRAVGLDPDRDIKPVLAGIDRMPDQLRVGQIDAFFWSGGLPTPAVQRLARTFPIRLIPLGDLVGALHRLSGASVPLYRAALLPSDLYPETGSREAISTIAIPNLLTTADYVTTDLAQAVTGTLINNRESIGRQMHAAQSVDLRTAIFTDPLPLHEGARLWYRRVKP